MRRLLQLGPTTDVVGSGNNGRQRMTRLCSTVRTRIVRYLHSVHGRLINITQPTRASNRSDSICVQSWSLVMTAWQRSVSCR